MEQLFPLLLLPVLFQLRAGGAEAGRNEMFAAIGSSVLLDPGYGVDLSKSEVLWTFTGADGNLVTILDYVPNHPMEEPNKHFESRLHFSSSNGSLRLNRLKPSDQGVYSIDVEGKLIRSTDLNLIEALSEPLINAVDVDSTIELTCRVSVGKARSILWRKGVEVLKNGQHYQLAQNSSKLIIFEASKSGCGIYTCTVENAVSKRNQSYTLVTSTVAPLHRYAEIFSIAALITAVAALALNLISFFFGPKTINLLFVQSELQVLQFLFLIGAFGCWIWVEGASEITVFPLVFVCLLSMRPLFLACTRKACDSKVLNKIPKSCRLTPIVTALSGIIVICMSTILITEIVRRTGKECEPAANLQGSIVAALGILFVSFLIPFLLHIICRKWNKGTNGTPSTVPSEKDPDERQQFELKEPFLKATTTDEEVN
ncbi:uncharacterized protein LOC144497485 [Mustelus asterias]